MYTISKRILDQAALTTGSEIDPSDVPDLGEAHELELLVTVLNASGAAGDGQSPTFLVQHAPINDRSFYVDFPTAVAVDLTVVGSTWIHVPYFTRYVAWFTSGTISDGTVVTLDLVAKG